MTSTTQ